MDYRRFETRTFREWTFQNFVLDFSIEFFETGLFDFFGHFETFLWTYRDYSFELLDLLLYFVWLTLSYMVICFMVSSFNKHHKSQNTVRVCPFECVWFICDDVSLVSSLWYRSILILSLCIIKYKMLSFWLSFITFYILFLINLNKIDVHTPSAYNEWNKFGCCGLYSGYIIPNMTLIFMCCNCKSHLRKKINLVNLKTKIKKPYHVQA